MRNEVEYSIRVATFQITNDLREAVRILIEFVLQSVIVVEAVVIAIEVGGW
jgi:hypothetical protein